MAEFKVGDRVRYCGEAESRVGDGAKRRGKIVGHHDNEFPWEGDYRWVPDDTTNTDGAGYWSSMLDYLEPLSPVWRVVANREGVLGSVVETDEGGSPANIFSTTTEAPLCVAFDQEEVARRYAASFSRRYLTCEVWHAEGVVDGPAPDAVTWGDAKTLSVRHLMLTGDGPVAAYKDGAEVVAVPERPAHCENCGTSWRAHDDDLQYRTYPEHGGFAGWLCRHCRGVVGTDYLVKRPASRAAFNAAFRPVEDEEQAVVPGDYIDRLLDQRAEQAELAEKAERERREAHAERVCAAIQEAIDAGGTVEAHMCDQPLALSLSGYLDNPDYAPRCAYAPSQLAGKWFPCSVRYSTDVSDDSAGGHLYHAGNIDAIRVTRTEQTVSETRFED